MTSAFVTITSAFITMTNALVTMTRALFGASFSTGSGRFSYQYHPTNRAATNSTVGPDEPAMQMIGIGIQP